MNESYLIAAAVLLLIVILGITGEAIWKYLTRERGPWVVTRVSADGSGGVEFEYAHLLGGGTAWTTNVFKAKKFGNIEWAKVSAEKLLADVAPLSKFVEGGK
jgi:hypothetical protein